MATERERPYAQFNFLVDLGGSPAGFQEVSGIGMEVSVAEYRSGDAKDNHPMKITTLPKVTDVTLKRGVVGKLDLYKWFNDIRDGKQDQLKTVTITLKDESRSGDAQQWVLMNARPTKYTGPSLSGKGTEIAIEELVLAYERLELK